MTDAPNEPGEPGESAAQRETRKALEELTVLVAQYLRERFPLGEGMIFTVILATEGGPAEGFSAMSYASSGKRDGMARMLTELLGKFETDGMVTEPTHHSMSLIRETVARIRASGADRQKLLSNARERVGSLAIMPMSGRRMGEAILLASEAMALYQTDFDALRKAGEP